MTNPASIFAVNPYAYTLTYKVTDCMRHLADKGFAGYELMMYKGHFWPGEADAALRREVRRVAEETKTRIVSFNMPNIDLNIAGASDEMRNYSLDLLAQFIELAGDVGAPSIVVGPGKANPLLPMPFDQLRGHFFRGLDRLAPIAKKQGVKILVENMPFSFLPDAPALMKALDEYGDDEIGVIYDVANGHFINEDPCDGLRLVKDRLGLVHFSDTGRSAYRHDPVGYGDLDFSRIPSVLAEIGYSELPVLEVVSRHADMDAEILSSAKQLAALGYVAKAA